MPPRALTARAPTLVLMVRCERSEPRTTRAGGKLLSARRVLRRFAFGRCLSRPRKLRNDRVHAGNGADHQNHDPDEHDGRALPVPVNGSSVPRPMIMRRFCDFRMVDTTLSADHRQSSFSRIRPRLVSAPRRARAPNPPGRGAAHSARWSCAGAHMPPPPTILRPAGESFVNACKGLCRRSGSDRASLAGSSRSRCAAALSYPTAARCTGKSRSVIAAAGIGLPKR